MKFMQFSLVLSIGIIIGFFAREYQTPPRPETDVTGANQTINKNATHPLTVITDQSQPETEVKALRQQISLLEQALKEQQQTNELNSNGASQKETPNEQLSKEVLVQVGVSESIAEDILKRLSKHEYELLALHDRAKREGYLRTSRYAKERHKLMENAPSLQDTIGKDAYDNYLYKTEQNNRVIVTTVMTDSPADQLGVQNGDIILNYANEKVLNWRELRELTGKGIHGEYVNLNILRDGKMLNILVPRGPLGVKLGVTKLDPLVQYDY